MTPEDLARVVMVVGVAAVPDVLTASEVESLIRALGEVTGAGVRGVLRIPAVAELACSPRLLDLARPQLTGEPRPVGRSRDDRHRRVLHIEYAGFDLPKPLRSHETT